MKTPEPSKIRQVRRNRAAAANPDRHAISPAEYARRRAALRERCGDAVAVLAGNTEGERGDLRSGFFQDSNFRYFTGWLQPGAMLVLAPKGRSGAPIEALVLPDLEPGRALWSGPASDASEPGLAKLLGIAHVVRRCQLERLLAELLANSERLACLSGSQLEDRFRAAFPFREIRPLNDEIAALRMAKSPAEIGLIREAVRITAEGQLRGWRALQSCSNEYEVAADITHEFLRRGAERHSFAPIVASGTNACVLHYSRNRAPLRKGALAVLDIGAEYMGYAGDLTRTVPVGGRFSKRQRELYEAVLAVQKEVIRAVKPGAFIGRQIPGSLHRLAVERLGEMRLGPKKQPLSRYFPHGIGHHLGMDVHDPSDSAAPLEPGMVITVEPGVYIPEEGIGIRIEDDLLVTERGAEVLSASLPKEVADVEALLAS